MSLDMDNREYDYDYIGSCSVEHIAWGTFSPCLKSNGSRTITVISDTVDDLIDYVCNEKDGNIEYDDEKEVTRADRFVMDDTIDMKTK